MTLGRVTPAANVGVRDEHILALGCTYSAGGEEIRSGYILERHQGGRDAQPSPLLQARSGSDFQT
jgi:hypothetical protein